MAIQTQLFYIGTSKVKEILAGGSVTSWAWGSYGSWTNVASPTGKTTTKVTYNASTKNAAGSSAYGGLGGVTFCGTAIPATATRVIEGIERTVNVRFYKRGYTFYTKTAALKKKKKMSRTKYTVYQYRLQYEDKPIVEKEYSTYINGREYIYFADHYFDDEGTLVTTEGHMLHPAECSIVYSDVRKNINGEANNNESRDNKGSYILSNVRANIPSLQFKWTGLSSEEGADLLDTLNPSKDTSGQYNYLTVQYLDSATNKPKNGTFYVSDRGAKKYADGTFKEITVTLTEV